MKSLLLGILVLSSVFAASIGTEVGYVDIGGVDYQNEKYVVSSNSLTIYLKSTKEFVPINYTLSLSPKNLEKLAKDFGVPLFNNALGFTIPEGSEQTFRIDVPEIVCGEYTASGEAYYTIDNGTLRKYENTLNIQVPCKSTKAKIVSKIVSLVPYSLLKGVAGIFGMKF